MNAFFDMHVHSKFSIDGVSTMEDYCLIAEKSGIRAICFTEHVDFNSEEKNLSIVKDNRKQNFVVEDYFSELNRLREKYSSIILLALIKEMGGDARIIHNKLHLDMRNVCINTMF